MYFVGVDLAWSRRNTSAVAVAHGDELVAWKSALHSLEEIVSFILARAGSAPAFVAIDAPITVPNIRGSRECDRLVSSLFRRHEAGVYPVNRTLLERYGGVRGQKLGERLMKAGFEHNPALKAPSRGRVFAEVFPHSAMVVIFRLDRTLKYKQRAGRCRSLRHTEFRRYQRLLHSLAGGDPPLRVPEEILDVEVERLRGYALKRYEDLLDAIICAYTASYCWHRGDCAVVGDLKSGYILTPLP